MTKKRLIVVTLCLPVVTGLHALSAGLLPFPLALRYSTVIVLSAVAAGLLITVRARRVVAARSIVADKKGSVEAIDFLLTMPVFFGLLLMLVQFALMLNAHQAVYFAAACAARSASVKNAVPNLPDRDKRAHTAAALALLPFAPTSETLSKPELGFATKKTGGPSLTKASGVGRPADERMQRKLAYALAATKVELAGGAAVTANVKFEVPVLVPLMKKIFGRQSALGWTTTLAASVAYPAEVD